MTRAEQERLVERYLGGQMNSAQEEEFFIMVAVDHDLRQTLKAYRIVESAIRKHRDTAPIHHGASRARVLAMLNADAVASQHGGNVAMESPHQASRPMGGLSASAARWAVSSVAAAALVVGAFVVAPLIDHTTDPVASRLRITPAQQAPAPLPSAPSQAADEPVTGGAEDHRRESTPLPRIEPRTAAVDEADDAHRRPDRDAAPHAEQRHDPPKQNKPGASHPPDRKQGSDRSTTTPGAPPASEPAGATVTPTLPAASKPDGQPKVVDSAARVRLQLQLPQQ